jgi:hypothetical protein
MKTLVLAGTLAVVFGFAACHSSTARTDTGITADVKKQLSDNHVPGAIDVTTDHAVVTLAGTVPDKNAKDRAADVADDVAGVKSVVNNLRTTMAGDAPAARLPGTGIAPNPPVLQPNAPPNAAPEAGTNSNAPTY